MSEGNLNTKFGQMAFDIAGILSRDAFWHGDRCTWIGYEEHESDGKKELVKSTVGPYVSNGIAGILQYLNQVNKIFPDPVIGHTMHGSRNQILGQFNQTHQNPGYYNGEIGMLYVLIQTDYLDPVASNLDYYFSSLQTLLDNAKNEISLDYLDGISGLYEPLVSLYDDYADHDIYYALNAFAKIAGSNITPESLSTYSPQGYVHSAPAILAASLRLCSLLELQEERDKIIQLINNYLPKIRFEFRDWWKNHVAYPSDDFNPYSIGWHSGLAGLVDALINIYDILESDEIKLQATQYCDFLLDVVENATAKEDWFANFSFSHGLAGIGSVLIKAAEKFNRLDYWNCACSIGDFGIDNIYKNGFDWPSGLYAPETFGSKPTYGLFDGISGTGMFYLKLNNAIMQSNTSDG